MVCFWYSNFHKNGKRNCQKYDRMQVIEINENSSFINYIFLFQFGHQENSSGVEILNALKFVRPGNGFVPKAVMFDKVGGGSTNFFFTTSKVEKIFKHYIYFLWRLHKCIKLKC